MPFTPGHTVWEVLDFGGTARMPSGEYEGTLIMKTHPVETESDVETLSLPDPQTSGRIPFARRFAELAREQGYPVFFSSRSPFTIAANLSGLENFCRWLMKKPALCRLLMEKALAHLFNVLDYWIELFGAENIWIWMSNPNEANQLFSARHVAVFALPWHQEYLRGLKERSLQRFGFHLYGDQNANLPIFAEADLWPHPSVLSFGQEVSLEQAGALFPKDIIFGNLDPNLLQIGTPQGIYDRCREIIREGSGVPGGFMLAPGCSIPATAPPVNVYALTRAALDFSST
jgi:uroporphyrinogen decarboxylase